MSPAALLLLSVLGAPYFSRPVDPVADLALLRAEVARGAARAEAWHARLELYLELGELDTIPELVELLAATFPEHPAFREARLMFLSLADRHEEALAVGEALLRDHPEHPTIRANLGRAYLAAGQPARGVNLLLAALSQGPIRTEEWDLLLENLGIRGPNPQAALATLEGKVAAHPELPSLRYVLMVALVRLGEYPRARALLERYPELAAHPDLQVFLHSGARN